MPILIGQESRKVNVGTGEPDVWKRFEELEPPIEVSGETVTVAFR